jgi:hypothetical protein
MPVEISHISRQPYDFYVNKYLIQAGYPKEKFYPWSPQQAHEKLSLLSASFWGFNSIMHSLADIGESQAKQTLGWAKAGSKINKFDDYHTETELILTLYQ